MDKGTLVSIKATSWNAEGQEVLTEHWFMRQKSVRKLIRAYLADDEVVSFTLTIAKHPEMRVWKGE